MGRPSWIRERGSPGARRIRTNISPTAIAKVTTAWVTLRKSQRVKSGAGCGPAPERAPGGHRPEDHLGEASVHTEHVSLTVEERGRSRVLHPPEELVPWPGVGGRARDGAGEQRVRASVAVMACVPGTVTGPAVGEAAGRRILRGGGEIDVEIARSASRRPQGDLDADHVELDPDLPKLLLDDEGHLLALLARRGHHQVQRERHPVPALPHSILVAIHPAATG